MIDGGWWMVDEPAQAEDLRLCRGEEPKQSSFTPTLGFECGFALHWDPCLSTIAFSETEIFISFLNFVYSFF